MSDQVWPSVEEHIRAKIKEEIDAQTDSISRGQCQTFEQYQRIVGRIAGMHYALDVFDEVFNHWKSQ